MVIGGLPEEANYDVELIDMTDNMRNCTKPSNYPGSQDSSFGTFLDGQVIVCGGYPATSACYTYIPDNLTWIESSTMNINREKAATAIVQDLWWITGGRNPTGYLSSTELFNYVNESFSNYIELPAQLDVHNLIPYDNSFVMLLGGQLITNKTFIFDANDATWRDGPSLQHARYHCQAGLTTYANGTKTIIVAGGGNETTTEILNLDTMTWSFGPELI